ncbi:hypothetical protein [Rhodovulum imhoffii]|nr:hypothetical protein [Rhodovulum imhoffii]MBK5933213.1 hypothetical protein [Rhodovulum imhoffii]
MQREDAETLGTKVLEGETLYVVGARAPLSGASGKDGMPTRAEVDAGMKAIQTSDASTALPRQAARYCTTYRVLDPGVPIIREERREGEGWTVFSRVTIACASPSGARS